MYFITGWWAEVKDENKNANNGKGIPANLTTAFDSSLKKYDAAIKTNKEKKTPESCQDAISALASVKVARKLTHNKLKRLYPGVADNLASKSQALNKLITDDETSLVKKLEKYMEAKAKIALGPPQLQTVGPQANLRKKNYDLVVDRLAKLEKALTDATNGAKIKTDDDLSEFITFLEGMQNNVLLYCKDKPEAKSFFKAYGAAVKDLRKIYEKWPGKQIVSGEFKGLIKLLVGMRRAEYIP